MAPIAEPPSPAPARQASRLERVRRLGRAVARVRAAEERLAAARAARAALELEDAEPHFTASYSSLEEMRAAHGGSETMPGRDTGAIAAAVRQRYEGRRQAD